MGGYGSGRWGTGKADAKPLVEDCRTLDIGPLTRDATIGPNLDKGGSLAWKRNGETVASIGFRVHTTDASAGFRLTYRFAHRGDEGSVDYDVPLITTTQPYGGLRWWFSCAAVVRAGHLAGVEWPSSTWHPEGVSSLAAIATGWRTLRAASPASGIACTPRWRPPRAIPFLP